MVPSVAGSSMFKPYSNIGDSSLIINIIIDMFDSTCLIVVGLSLSIELLVLPVVDSSRINLCSYYH